MTTTTMRYAVLAKRLTVKTAGDARVYEYHMARVTEAVDGGNEDVMWRAARWAEIFALGPDYEGYPPPC